MKELIEKLKTKEALRGIGLFLLGIIGISFDLANQIPNMPELAVKILEIVQFVIGAMGLREVMAQSSEKIRKIILDLKSKTFWGSLLMAIVVLASHPDMLNLNDEMKAVLGVISTVLAYFGLKDAAHRGILNGSDKG